MDKSFKLLGSKHGIKRAGSTVSVGSVRPVSDDVSEKDSSPGESERRRQSPPRAAWGKQPDEPLSIKGQRAPIKSPRQVTSPPRSVTSPPRLVTVPTTSSSAKVMHPRTSVTSPRAQVTSPRAQVTSPRGHVTSPRNSAVQPARHSVTSPRSHVASSSSASKSNAISPRPNMTPRATSHVSSGSADNFRATTTPRSTVQRSQSMDQHLMRRTSHRGAVHPEPTPTGSLMRNPAHRSASHSDHHVISPRISDTLKHAARVVSPKSGYRSQSNERVRVNSPKDEPSTPQEQTPAQNVSMSVDKPKFLEYLVNEQTEIKLSPRGRLRKHFSRLKTRVASASPSQSTRFRQERLLPDDYVPNQDPETMVSRESPGGGGTGGGGKRSARPHSTTGVGLATRAESVREAANDTAKDAYLYLKAVTSNFNERLHDQEEHNRHHQREDRAQGGVTEHQNGHQSKHHNDHRNGHTNGHQNGHQQRSHELQNGWGDHHKEQRNFHPPETRNEKSIATNDEQTVQATRQTSSAPVGLEAQACGYTAEGYHSQRSEASTEVQEALKSLSSQPRHVRRSSSSIDPKRDYRRPVFKSSKMGDTESTEHKEEVSRQLKQFKQNSGHFKPGAHFQHLYMKRAESIVQKQILQKAHSPTLHVTVPQVSDLEHNTYAIDVPETPKVPVLRMTIAKVKSSQPVKTYIQVGKTIKEASFSSGVAKHFTDNTPTPPKPKMNHLIVLPSYNSEPKDDNGPRNRVHFAEDVVSEPQHQLTHSTSSILKKTNCDAHNDANQISDTKDKTDFSSYNGSEHIYSDRNNRGTAIIAVHQDHEDKPKAALRKYSSISATDYGLVSQVPDSPCKEDEEAKTTTTNGNSVAEPSLSKDQPAPEPQGDAKADHPQPKQATKAQEKLPEQPEQHVATMEQSSSSDEQSKQAQQRFQLGSPKPTKVSKFRTEGTPPVSLAVPADQASTPITPQQSREEIATTDSKPSSSSTSRSLKDKPKDKPETTKENHKSPVSILRHLKDDSATPKDTKPRGLQRRRSQKVHALPSDGYSILSPRKPLKKKQESMDIVDDKQVKVDHTLMVDYLTLVKQHPEEYASMQKDAVPASRKPVGSIVGMASVFRRGHHEKVGPPESIVVQAAYELGSKIPHPVCVRYEKLERQRVEIATKANQAVTRSVNKRQQQETLDMLGQQAEQLEALTPLEKSRAKLEIWLKGLSAAQQIKVKELALKEMGEEAHSIRKWWLAHKYCKYLRQKTKPD